MTNLALASKDQIKKRPVHRSSVRFVDSSNFCRNLEIRMPIGPRLPPSAEKRKRPDGDESSDTDHDTGPQPPKPSSEEHAVKKPRVIGPSMPASAVEDIREVALEKNQSDSDSSDDEDFGPSLPTEKDASQSQQPSTTTPISTTATRTEPSATQSKRDEWMTLAPASGDWSQRVDPTRLKNRKFNTGKGGVSSSNGANAWHETPEQKQARLQREVLGIKDKKEPRGQPQVPAASPNDGETARRMEEYKAQRGPSLYEAHQKQQKGEEDDDPSARAFDREKDIRGGLQLNSSQRRAMLKKSADFNSRFSTAKYL